MAELEALTYPQTAQEIAQEIVSQFPPSIFSADLRRLIVNAIDMDRQRARGYLDEKANTK